MNRPSIYTRPNKPLVIPVRKRGEAPQIEAIKAPEIVAVDKATECHVTPYQVAERMVEYLGPVGDFNTLEPSAGTGQLVRALLASGHSDCELVMVERHIGLANQLRQYGPVTNACFLETAETWRGRVAFPRIIMNPPFSKVRQHIEAALSLSNPNGHYCATLVALVPSSYQHEAAQTLEHLPNNTFATAQVHTKIIRFHMEV